MDIKNEWKKITAAIALFFLLYNMPLDIPIFRNAIMESLYLAKWYAREHVILCLLPAFFIAGAISVFIKKESVMKYLGAGSNKIMAYGVASVSGTILAVCSCTVLPLFAGIYKMGAGMGPASAFLYSGPAINILAIILTARILGLELGLARGLGAIVFSVIIGILMQLFFKDDDHKNDVKKFDQENSGDMRPLWANAFFFGVMTAILVFANWGRPLNEDGLWGLIFSLKWLITATFSVVLGLILIFWFELSKLKLALAGIVVLSLSMIFPDKPLIPFAAGIIALSFITATGKGEAQYWFESTWDYAKQIAPLLIYGVLAAGFFLGRPGHEGIIPPKWIETALGGNGLGATAFASVAGAFMYFATLTEVPIVQGLMGSGMGKGPALALLLAGPALSLPSMLVINKIIGTKKTVVYMILVIVMSTITGWLYGKFF